jgi:hypothetical protein
MYYNMLTRNEERGNFIYIVHHSLISSLEWLVKYFAIHVLCMYTSVEAVAHKSVLRSGRSDLCKVH